MKNTNIKKCGVYTITNTVNGKLYVGSTTQSFMKRWVDHKYLLRNNKHHNTHLQRAWLKYGETYFQFDILEICNVDTCLIREQYWMDHFNSYKEGYNRTPKAGNSSGTKREESTLIKLRSLTNYKKANVAWKGNKHSEESLEIMRQKRATQDMSWMQTAEYKAKKSAFASEHLMGNTRRRNTGKYGICEKVNGEGEVVEIFNTLRDAFLNEELLNGSKIIRSCQTGIKCKGYLWNVYYKNGTKVEKAGINSVNCLGSLEEDNQQPSSCGDTEKGSTTSSESQVDNNSTTKAGHQVQLDDDIV